MPTFIWKSLCYNLIFTTENWSPQLFEIYNPYTCDLQSITQSRVRIPAGTAEDIHLTYVAFIEPCFGIGHSLSLICQMTCEDISINSSSLNVQGKILSADQVFCPTLCLYGCQYGWAFSFFYVCITSTCMFVYMHISSSSIRSSQRAKISLMWKIILRRDRPIVRGVRQCRKIFSVECRKIFSDPQNCLCPVALSFATQDFFQIKESVLELYVLTSGKDIFQQVPKPEK